MEFRGQQKSAHGQSLLEFALVLPLLLIIIVGVFDLGRAFFALITINNAAREGARYGTLYMADRTLTVPQIYNNIQAAAVNESQGSFITINASSVQIRCYLDDLNQWDLQSTPTRCPSGYAVKVTVSYTFQSLLNFIIQSQINMQRSIQMAVP